MKTKSNSLFYVFLGILFVASCSIVYFVQYSNNSPDEVLTEIKLSTNHVEIGKSNLKKTSFANFFVQNTGQNAMMIKSVKVDCHCTVAEWDKNSVEPRDSTKIQVKYDNHLLGYYKRVVVVEVNVKNSPLVLTFAGETVE